VLKASGVILEYVWNFKFDGASISITYRRGIYQELYTAGWLQSDDVTLILRHIRSIP